jgi:hypothetical protein
VFFIFERGFNVLEEREKFFMLPKSIVKHDILHTKNNLSLRIFLLILGNACYKDGVQIKGSNTILMRGQWLRSNRKLQKDLGASPTTLTNGIKWLEGKRLIKTEITNLGTIFTVLNYDVYQGKAEEKEEEKRTHERNPTSNRGVTEGVTQGGGCYCTSNGGCYCTSNNTNNYNLTKNYNNSVIPINSIRGEKHNERDSSVIEWEQFPHLDF